MKEEIERIREELEGRGVELPPVKPDSAHFDSNCITPGTSFMARLAICLQYYVHDRMNNNPAWQGIKVASHVTSYASHVTYYASHVTSHAGHVTYFASHVTMPVM